MSGKRSSHQPRRRRLAIGALIAAVAVPTMASAAGDRAFGWSASPHLPWPLRSAAVALAGDSLPGGARVQAAGTRFETPIAPTDDQGTTPVGRWPAGPATSTDTSAESAPRSAPTVAPAATVEIGLGSTSLAFDASGLAPGDVAVAPLVIQNQGTTKFTYSMSASMPGVLGNVLRFQARAGVTNCSPAHYTEDGLTLADAARIDGASIGGRPDASYPIARTVDAGYQTTMCVAIWVPLRTGNEIQGTSGTLTLDFTATRVD